MFIRNLERYPLLILRRKYQRRFILLKVKLLSHDTLLWYNLGRYFQWRQISAGVVQLFIIIFWVVISCLLKKDIKFINRTNSTAKYHWFCEKHQKLWSDNCFCIQWRIPQEKMLAVHKQWDIITGILFDSLKHENPSAWPSAADFIKGVPLRSARWCRQQE